VVIYLERGAVLHMVQQIPLPLTVSCFSKIQIGFTFLIPAHLGSPGERAIKRVCVCVCVSLCVKMTCRIEMCISSHGLASTARSRPNTKYTRTYQCVMVTGRWQDSVVRPNLPCHKAPSTTFIVVTHCGFNFACRRKPSITYHWRLCA